MAVIVEGVEHEFDEIVVEEVFPPRQAGTNLFPVTVEADEDGVQVLGVVAEIGFRTFRDGRSVARFPLFKTVRSCQLPLPCRAGFHPQEVLKMRRTGDAGDANGAKFLSLGEERARRAQQQPQPHGNPGLNEHPAPPRLDLLLDAFAGRL